MKRIFLAILFILPITIMTYGQDFYWYKGKQIPLRRGNQKYILYEESNKKSAPLKVIEGGEISCSKTNSVKWGIIGQETITDNAKVSYQIPSFLCSDTTKNMFITRPPMTRLIVLPQEKLSVMVNCLSFVEKKYTQLAVYVSND